MATTQANPESTARKEDWRKVIRELGPVFTDRAAIHDQEDSFVADNYADLKQRRFFSAGVPTMLGGGGVNHSELCGLLRDLAHSCSSTALAVSMHQHLLAAAVWRYHHGQPGEALLRKVAEQELVLVSTGAHDWLASNGQMEKVEGGYRVSARKAFSSGSPAGNLLVSSAQYEDPDDGPVVLHFAVFLSADGVKLLDDWQTLGMRGTGSQTVVLENVFVPEEAVTLKRPRGSWHPGFNVVATVALPLIMAVYVGIAEAAAEMARNQALKKRDDPNLPYLLGELENSLTTAQLALDSMISISNDYDFEASNENANRMLIRKTIATKAVMATAEKALEVVGGVGFFRSFGLERLLRDAHGAQFHPLPEKQQLLMTGRLALGLEPVASST